MAIFKNCQVNNFAMIPNELLDDAKLSWKAKGVLCYLLRLPCDWKIHTEEIEKHSRDGIDCLNSTISELIKFGYIVRTKIRGENGRFGGYEYSVFNVPTVTDFSKNGKTKNGKSKTTNTNVTNTNLEVVVGDTPNVINLQQSFEDNICELKPTTLISFNKYVDILDKDYLITVIDYCTQIGMRSFAGFKVAIDNFIKNNITTEETLNLYILEYRQKKINPAKRGRKPKVGTFNDYPQRDYDFETLEKKLLGWDKEDTNVVLKNPLKIDS